MTFLKCQYDIFEMSITSLMYKLIIILHWIDISKFSIHTLKHSNSKNETVIEILLVKEMYSHDFVAVSDDNLSFA